MPGLNIKATDKETKLEAKIKKKEIKLEAKAKKQEIKLEKKEKKKIKKDRDILVSETVEKFNHELSGMFKLLKKKMPALDDLRSFHNKFKLSRWVRPTAAIEANKINFWNNKDLILTKDPDFFLDGSNLEFGEGEEEAHDRNSDLGEELMDTATPEELEAFWGYLQNMLRHVIVYMQQTQDHA